MLISYLDPLLSRSKRYRFGLYMGIIIAIMVGTYMFLIAPQTHERAQQRTVLINAKALLAAPSEQVQIASTTELPAVAPPILLQSFERTSDRVKLTLQGGFFELQHWLATLGATAWAPIHSQWQWHPEQLQLTLELQQFEMREATPKLTQQNPFPEQQNTHEVTKPPQLPACKEWLSEDFRVIAIIHKKALIEMHGTTPHWFRVGAELTPYALKIQHIAQNKVVVSASTNTLPSPDSTPEHLPASCETSSLKPQLPQQPYLRWLP